MHNDLNPLNILVDPADPELVTGIIDFGDVIHTALIADVVLDVAFSRWLGVAGIALASPAVSLVSLCVLVVLLRRHEPRVFMGERAW